ncbi:MAG: LTA synthase family protein, partial [Acidobacteriota bacterium]
ALLGILFDLSLAAGLWGVALAAGAGWRACLLLGPAAAASTLLRGADVAHCELTRYHWAPDAFVYLAWENLGLLVDPWAMALLAAWLGTTAALLAAVFLAARYGGPLWRWPRRPGRLAIAVLPCAVVLTVNLVAPAPLDGASLLPETSFFCQWARGVPEAARSLGPEQRRRWSRLGLIPATADNEYPLLHPAFDPTPFPFPAREARGPPNLVITFVEGFNREYLSSLSGLYLGVMPEASRLVARLTAVDGYYSTTAPTVSGLVAGLCSLYAPGQMANQGPRGPATTPAICLPEILRESGYRTVFVQGADRSFAHKDLFLSQHGFEELHDRASLSERFPDRPTTSWGHADATLVDYTEEQLLRLERERLADGRPFLLVMLTLDSHNPDLDRSDCPLPPDVTPWPTDPRAQNRLRNLFCADRALGRLGRFLLAPGRAEQTVWVVTGDHRQWTLPGLPEPATGVRNRLQGRFGEMVFLLHDPTHVLPERYDSPSCSLDLSPSLLHLLGLPEHPSTMSGHSLFGRRRGLPWMVGRVHDTSAFVRGPRRERAGSRARIADLCARGEDFLAEDGVAITACELDRWLDWQNSLWRDQRIAPIGGQDTDN